MPHMADENSKKIVSMSTHGNSCIEIAAEIGVDPTTTAKEIKKNRIISKEAVTKGNKILCMKLERFPYVCRYCSYKYTTCTLTQLKYDAVIAQKKYEFRLHEARKGINLTKEEHEALTSYLRMGKEFKRSVYNSLLASKIYISLPTVYRYIDEKRLTSLKWIFHMQLPIRK